MRERCNNIPNKKCPVSITPLPQMLIQSFGACSTSSCHYQGMFEAHLFIIIEVSKKLHAKHQITEIMRTKMWSKEVQKQTLKLCQGHALMQSHFMMIWEKTGGYAHHHLLPHKALKNVKSVSKAIQSMPGEKKNKH